MILFQTRYSTVIYAKERNGNRLKSKIAKVVEGSRSTEGRKFIVFFYSFEIG